MKQYPIKNILLKLMLLFLLPVLSINSLAQDRLPRSTPEREGVSPEGIRRFIEAADKHPFEFHSFMLLKNGKVIAEGWWDPYKPDLKHTMYSVTKSFTATAVGYAVNENLITVQDTVIRFFPSLLPDTVSPNLARMTIKDLLTMTAGNEPAGALTDDNWVRAFLHEPVPHVPGTRYFYNTLASHMLSAIVQQKTGTTVEAYLSTRLFKPLGIRDADWVKSPQGITSGGWGLRLKTEDMARFGQLLLDKGKWKGKQIMPAQWVEDATRKQVESWPVWVPAGTPADSSDWIQGYGYQFWRNRGNSYRADGAFGQLIVVMPEYNAVLAVTAGGQLMQDEMNVIRNYLFPALQQEEMIKGRRGRKALQQALRNLALPLPEKSWKGSSAIRYSGKNFRFKNPSQTIRFDLSNPGRINIQLNEADTAHQLSFGNGTWHRGQTYKTAPDLPNLPVGLNREIYPVQYAGAYTWKDDTTLELTLRYIESPFHEIYTYRFSDQGLTMELWDNVSGKKGPFEGELVR